MLISPFLGVNKSGGNDGNFANDCTNLMVMLC